MQVQDNLLQHDVGVIIARFQVHKLHEMHIDLINTVRARHQRVIILLGNAATMFTKENPLDFQMRAQMIREQFPDITDIGYIDDHPNDATWSKNLDRLISKNIGERTAVLYGSRDSFIRYYGGRFPTAELVSERIISGKELRKIAGNVRRASEDFRAGVIHCAQNQYAHVWPTVDIVIRNEDSTKILLGRKIIDGNCYRFPGGFVKPKLSKDDSGRNILERNARAETSEETNVEISDPVFVGDTIIDDWRYRGEENKPMTTLFTAKYIFGSPRPGDDVDEVRWTSIEEIQNGSVVLVDNHKILFEMFTEWLAKQ